MSVSDKWWFYHENKAAFPLTGVQPFFLLILQSKLESLILFIFFEIESVFFEGDDSSQSLVKIECLGEFFFLAIMSGQLVGGSQIH